MNQQSSKRKWLGIVIGCAFALLVAACAYTLNSPKQTPVVISTAAATSIVPATVQAMPTLSKDELEIIKLKLENKKIDNENSWWWITITSLIPPVLSVLGVFAAVFVGFKQWKGQQEADREKRHIDFVVEQGKLGEERFQNVVKGFESERVEARVGAAILLLTFLRPGYEQFYSQVFYLAISLLRLRKYDPKIPEPVDAMSQALITVLRQSFYLARGDDLSKFESEDLDATGVQLDNAYLSKTDLRKIRLRNASLRGTYFWRSQLQEAYFKHSNLKDAFFVHANLEEADLGDTILVNANFGGAYLRGAHFRDADLKGADFTGADLSDTRIQNAKSLKGTILRGVNGLSPSQLSACAAKGAIVDDGKSP